LGAAWGLVAIGVDFAAEAGRLGMVVEAKSCGTFEGLFWAEESDLLEDRGVG